MSSQELEKYYKLTELSVITLQKQMILNILYLPSYFKLWGEELQLCILVQRVKQRILLIIIKRD